MAAFLFLVAVLFPATIPHDVAPPVEVSIAQAEVAPDPLPPPPPPSLTELIDAAAIAAGHATTTLRAIAWCESQNRQYDADGDPLWSKTGDVGVFQINQVHRKELRKLGLDVASSTADNIAFAIALYERNGTRDWNNSARCWRPLLARPELIPKA